MRSIVEPQGPPDAPIVILGDAPESRDDWSGKPWSGQIGELFFDDILARAGIDRDNCLTLFTYWQKPLRSTPQDRSGISTTKDPTRYHTKTLNAIAAHPRSLIIAAGGHALKLLTDEDSITSWRGSIMHGHHPCPIVPMVDPEDVNRTPKLKALSRHDALRCRDLLSNPALNDGERVVWHAGNSTPEQLYTRICAMGAGASSTDVVDRFLSFDIETFGGTITCLGVGTDPREAVVVPLTACGGEYTPARQAELLGAAQSLLEGPLPKVGQNLDYDCQYLWKVLGIGVNNVWMDTMVAHSVMQPELPHDLGTLTSLYTLHPYYKDMRKGTQQAQYGETAWRYNGLDVCITHDVAGQLAEEMKQTGTWDYFHDVAMPAQKTLIRMEHKGVRIDETLRQDRLANMDTTAAKMLANPALLGVNPRSPKQVKEKFVELLPVSMRPSKADVHALKSLRRRCNKSKAHVSAFITAILDVRHELKIISTYLKAEAHDDGRMRTSYRVSATDTGRISSSKDVFRKGMNLQNVPKSQRDWFVPDEGLVFWACDASQIEARITAWLCQDESYVTGFLDTERDLHSENAAALFGIKLEDVHGTIPGSTYSYRDLGKRATHAMNYGVGPRKLADMLTEEVPTLGITQTIAAGYIETFFDLRPGLLKWHHKIAKDLTVSREVRTPYGMRRYFLGQPRGGKMLNSDLHRTAIAFVPQHMAAVHLNTAIVRVEKRLDAVGRADLLLQVHDEMAGQCAPDDLDLVRSVVTEEMEKPLPLFWQDHQLQVPADFASGHTWKECK